VRRESICLTLIVTAALLGGCGSDHETVDDTIDATTKTTAREGRPSFAGEPSPTFPKELHVSLDGQMNAADIALLMAVKKGYFDDVGLTVYPGIPVAPRRPVSYVAAYTDDIALAQQPQVAMAKAKGAPIVTLGSLVRQPTDAMIWLKGSGIRTVADLQGKTIAVPGIPYQEELLKSILEGAGVDPGEVEVKQAGYRLLPALENGKADAIFGGSWNIEGVALRERGLRPVIKRVQQLGAPDYDELVVITRANRAAREPQVPRRFMAALKRGVAAVKRYPRLAVELIESSPHEYEITTRETMSQVRATAPLLFPEG